MNCSILALAAWLAASSAGAAMLRLPARTTGARTAVIRAAPASSKSLAGLGRVAGLSSAFLAPPPAVRAATLEPRPPSAAAFPPLAGFALPAALRALPVAARSERVRPESEKRPERPSAAATLRDAAGVSAPQAGGGERLELESRRVWDGERARAVSERGPPPRRERLQLVDAALDTLNPFALLNNKVFGVSHRRLAPASFFRVAPGENVVGINGVSRDELYLKAADFMTGAGSAGVRQYRAARPNRLVDQLWEAYLEGGPITRLVIAAHGHSGSFSIGGFSMDGDWARANAGRLELLPEDLFAPGAKIALVSCSVAQGYLFSRDAGVASLVALFSPLLKRGGTIRASTRYVDPELGRIPARYKGALERVARHLLAPVLTLALLLSWLGADWRSKTRKVIEIPIPARPSPDA